MKNKGITLISLVITIIILIILSSVAIYLSLNNNGIFTKTKQAKEETNKQTATEIINLKITNCQINKYAEKQEMPTLKELSEALKDDNEIQYVTEKSQIASTKYEVGENPSSIYTKLNNYPYEFEINSSLQLASIDGVKITANNTNNSTNWTLWKQGKGYTSEENAIELPTNFSELLIEVSDENNMTYSYTILINKQMLSETWKTYALNYQQDTYSSIGALVCVNDRKLYLGQNWHYSTNYTNTGILSVYYR